MRASDLPKPSSVFTENSDSFWDKGSGEIYRAHLSGKDKKHFLKQREKEKEFEKKAKEFAEKNRQIEEANRQVEEARLAGISVDELIHARRVKEEFKQKSDLLSRTEPCNWATLYVFLASEKQSELYVFDYLNRCDTATKKNDLNKIVDELKLYIEDAKNQGTQAHKDLSAYYTQLQLDKDKMPTDSLPRLTLLTARALFKEKLPKHANNDSNDPEGGLNVWRGVYSAEEMSKTSWGKIIGGLALVFLGVTLILGVSFIKQGCREKKFADHAYRMFKPMVAEVVTTPEQNMKRSSSRSIKK